jgi:predicted DNA binding protein
MEVVKMTNNTKFDRLEMKIEDILKLAYDSEEEVYSFGELYMFNMIQNLHDELSDQNFESLKQLKARSYVKDYCRDSRSRELYVMLYKNRPFAMYQYIGRGSAENEEIFDKEVYSEFVKDYIEEYLEKSQFVEKCSQVDSIYTIENYNMAYFEIVDNQIYAKPWKE